MYTEQYSWDILWLDTIAFQKEMPGLNGDTIMLFRIFLLSIQNKKAGI